MRGQAALEFLVLVGFMLLVFTTFYLVIDERSQAQREKSRVVEIETLAEIIHQELTLTQGVHDGYRRTFEIPRTINGDVYTVGLYPVSNPSEIVISTSEGEYVFFLEFSLSGGSDIQPGYNEVSKHDGIVQVNAVAQADSELQCLTQSDCVPLSSGECNTYACVGGKCKITPKVLGTTCVGDGIDCLEYACDGLGSCAGQDRCAITEGTGYVCNAGSGTCTLACDPGATRTGYNAGGTTLWGDSGKNWDTSTPIDGEMDVCCADGTCVATTWCGQQGVAYLDTQWSCGEVDGNPSWIQCDEDNDGKLFNENANLCCSKYTSDPDGVDPIEVGMYGFTPQLSPHKTESASCYDGSDNDCDGLTDGEDSSECPVSYVTINSVCGEFSTFEDLVANTVILESHNDITYDWISNGNSIAFTTLSFALPDLSGRTQDYSLNRYTYGVVGATYSATGGVNGGGAYLFDGNDYINLGDGTDGGKFNNGFTERSIALWFAPSYSSLSERMSLFEEGGSVNGMSIYIDNPSGASPTLYAGAWSGSAILGEWLSYQIPEVSTFQHVALVYDWSKSKEVRLYYNGVLADSATITGAVAGHSGAGAIGAGKDALYHDGHFTADQFYFDGTIDHFVAYDHAISADQIAKLHALDHDELAAQETIAGEKWKVNVTPTNGIQQTRSVVSTQVTITDGARPECIACPPSQAASFTVVPSATSAEIRWIPAQDVQEQILYVDSNPSAVAGNCVEDCLVIATLDESASTYIVTGLDPETPYHVKIIGRNDVSCSNSYSDTFTTTATCSGCWIDGECIPDQTTNDANSCEICSPTDNGNDWTVKSDGATCNDGLFCTNGEVCTGGVCGGGTDPCTGLTPICDESGDSCVECTDSVLHCSLTQSCVNGDCTCLADQCEYGGECFDSYDRAPYNSCHVCRPDQGGWKPAGNGASCDDGNICTVGDQCDVNANCVPGTSDPCSNPSLPACLPNGNSYTCVQCVEDGDCGPTSYNCYPAQRYNGGVWEYRGRIAQWPPTCGSSHTCSYVSYTYQYCMSYWTPDYDEAASTCYDNQPYDNTNIPTCLTPM